MQGLKGIALDLCRWRSKWKITCGLQASIRVSRVYGSGQRKVEINPPSTKSGQRAKKDPTIFI